MKMPPLNQISTTLTFGVLTLMCLMALGDPPTKFEETLPGPDGVLVPWRTCDVACIEMGLIEKIHVKTGDVVTAGMRLAELQSESFKWQVQVSEAQAASQGRINTAGAEVLLNERKVVAYNDARKNEFTTQMELERALADLEIARGRLQSEVEEKRILELRREHQRQQLSERTVLAPIDGIVAEIHKGRGEFAGPNSPEILRIVDVSKLRASFYLTESEVHSLPSDRQVKVQMSNGLKIPAEVENVAPVANAESGLIEINVLVDNTNADILSSRCTLLINAPAS